MVKQGLPLCNTQHHGGDSQRRRQSQKPHKNQTVHALHDCAVREWG